MSAWSKRSRNKSYFALKVVRRWRTILFIFFRVSVAYISHRTTSLGTNGNIFPFFTGSFFFSLYGDILSGLFDISKSFLQMKWSKCRSICIAAYRGYHPAKVGNIAQLVIVWPWSGQFSHSSRTWIREAGLLDSFKWANQLCWRRGKSQIHH